MKDALPLSLLLWASLAGCAAAADTVEFVQEGVVREQPEGPDLAAKLVRLLERCSVELRPEMSGVSPKYFVWAESLATTDHIRLTLDPARTMNVLGAGRVEVRELLIPMPAGEWPGPLMVREGDAARAFTKYSPVDVNAVSMNASVEAVFPRSRDRAVQEGRRQRMHEEAQGRCAESRERATARAANTQAGGQRECAAAL